jgi:hypothetical protein
MQNRVFKKPAAKKPSKPNNPQTNEKPTAPFPLEPIGEHGCPGCGMMSFVPPGPSKR